MISIKHNIDKFVNGAMKNMSKQIKFAHNVATTRIAHKVREAETKEIKNVFDQPTTTTQKAVRYKTANKSQPYAVVYLHDFYGKGQSPNEYLQHHVFGGTRKIKRTEQWLRDAGILPNNQYIAPAKKATLNKYGNITAVEHIKVLSYLKAHPESGYVANVTAKSKAKWNKQGLSYFVMYKASQPIGIWRRTNKKIKPVFMFINTPHYRKEKFDFYEVGRRVVNAEWPGEIKKALKDAIATAGFKGKW